MHSMGACLLHPLDGTASAQQQFPNPSSERLEHSQLGPVMTAGLTETEGRQGSQMGRLQVPHHREKGVPRSTVGARSEYGR